MSQTLTPKRELWLLITLAGIQFTNILDFMIMMPLGPQFTALFHISDAQFGLLVSAYTLSAGASGLLASTYIDRFDRKRLLLVLYCLFALATLLRLHAPASAWQRIRETVAEPNHRRAFVFSVLIMFAGFTIIPYITIFMQTNVGMHPEQIPLIYLCGGVATLVSARWFGRLADSLGKFETFRLLAMAVVVPMFGITLLVPTSLWVVLGTSTLFFVCMSGRMIPCMAMLTSAANPAWRGTFMTINSAVQSASVGIAALVGATASLLAIGVGRKLNLHAPRSPPKA